MVRTIHLFMIYHTARHNDKMFPTNCLMASYPGDKSVNSSKITGFAYPVRMHHTKFRCGWVISNSHTRSSD